MTDLQQGFLAAVLAEPKDDAVRLIYADWLEENACEADCFQCAGQGGHIHVLRNAPFTSSANAMSLSVYKKFKNIGWRRTEPTTWAVCLACRGKKRVSNYWDLRAEFIRLQCELANLPENDPQVRKLHQRERELLHNECLNYWELIPWASNSWTMTFDAHHPKFRVGRKEGHHDIWCTLRRGFIEEISCKGDDWLLHGCSIQQTSPVQKVKLTTQIRWACSEHYSNPAKPDERTCTLCYTNGSPSPYYHVGTYDSSENFYKELVLHLIERTWPGVDIRFPGCW